MKMMLIVLVLLSGYVNAGTADQVQDKNSLTDLAIAKGYAGYAETGIARFLYKVKHHGGLKDGVGKVYWSDSTENDAKFDKKFEAAQIVDGFVLYNFSELNNDEFVEFTIAVPHDTSYYFLTGQTLRARCHSYAGNLEFATAIGGKEYIPLFKPVSSEICPATEQATDAN